MITLYAPRMNWITTAEPAITAFFIQANCLHVIPGQQWVLQGSYLKSSPLHWLPPFCVLGLSHFLSNLCTPPTPQVTEHPPAEGYQSPQPPWMTTAIQGMCDIICFELRIYMHALNKHAAISLNECVNYLTRTCAYSTFAFIILVHFIAFQAVAFKSTQGVAAVWPDWVAAMTIFCALIDILQGMDREIPNYYCAIIIIRCIDCKEVIILL